MEPQVWHTLVVRLWRDGDGLKVRFLAGPTGQGPSNVMLATSVDAATRQFEQWLRATAPDSGGTTRETQRRRWSDGGADSPHLASGEIVDDATRDDVRREPS